MESYQYLNHKTELSTNQNKLLSPFNKNLQIQNFFRGDSNIYKQKNKVYNLNNKKEILFSSRQKENDELGLKGPKILTINFPPEFMLSNNNSRKNSSQEKYIYPQKKLMINYDINNKIRTEKNFANTMNKEFQKFNSNNNNPNKKEGQKLIAILPPKQQTIFSKLNKKENKYKIQKKNILYTKLKEDEYKKVGLLSDNNLDYIHNETELNSGRGRRKLSSDEKDLEFEKNNNKLISNNLRTE